MELMVWSVNQCNKLKGRMKALQEYISVVCTGWADGMDLC